MIVVTFTPVVPWYARQLAGDWSDSPGEVLIVLGGGTIDRTTLAPGSYWRCVYADRTWRLGGFRQMVVSGADVAAPMRDFLICHGVPGTSIRMEEASHSTRENAVYTTRMLAGVPGRKVLLTSDYHAFRARRAFAKAGLDVVSRPFPDVIKASMNFAGRWEAFIVVSHETAKIAYYWLRGWI
jgi:uncharacterized SAM-binding protein YcdF (DUF218 family)